MILKSLLFCFFTAFMLACSSSNQKQYKLTDEQLAHLMFDIQLAETTLNDLSPEQRDSIKPRFDLRLQEVYHLSKGEIKEVVDQLQGDPEKLKKIVNRVKEMADSIQ